MCRGNWAFPEPGGTHSKVCVRPWHGQTNQRLRHHDRRGRNLVQETSQVCHGGQPFGRARVAHGPSKDAKALNSYFEQFDEQTLDCLEWVTMDISAAYISAVKENTKASIAFDNFHVMMALTGTVDKVRRMENNAAMAKVDKSLKDTMYPLRRARRNIRRKERIRVKAVKKTSYKLRRAWQSIEWARQIMHLKRKKRKTFERHWKK